MCKTYANFIREREIAVSAWNVKRDNFPYNFMVISFMRGVMSIFFTSALRAPGFEA